jgi:hypothetical protein
VRPGDVALQLITSSDRGGVARLAAYIIRWDETRLASQVQVSTTLNAED